MSNLKTTYLPSPRKTYLIQCTYGNPSRIHLDFKSSLGVDWAAKWVQLHGGLKTPLSGVMRRALEVYVAHLEQLPPDRVTSEVRNVKTACHGTHTPSDEQDAATARLEASLEALPPFDVVLLGAHQVAAREAMHKHLEQFNHIPTKKAPQP